MGQLWYILKVLVELCLPIPEGMHGNRGYQKSLNKDSEGYDELNKTPSKNVCDRYQVAKHGGRTTV